MLRILVCKSKEECGRIKIVSLYSFLKKAKTYMKQKVCAIDFVIF